MAILYAVALASLIAGILAGKRGLSPRPFTGPSLLIFGVMVALIVALTTLRIPALRVLVFAAIVLTSISTPFTLGLIATTLYTGLRSLAKARNDLQAVLREHGIDDDLPL